jgi:transaldolase/glucose-6-phosphate isomerase
MERQQMTQATNASRAYDEFGQSIWYDNIRRSALKSGGFKKLVEAGVRGCTSNPTIFDKAIGSSTDYDAALGRLVAEGKSLDEIYYDLVIEDIRDAADVLKPIYDSSLHEDGYISVEVRPEFARDTASTVAEAKKLKAAIARSNVMIKVPATDQGLAAITELTGAGISINVTLIFSVEQYKRVAEAYIAGLEIAAKNNVDLGNIASVASFFVSRIDSSVDALVKSKIDANPSEADRLAKLQGKAAIANAKQAYRAFKQIFSSERFDRLLGKGAHVQRVLWASTGTKNPKYPDTLYVDELIGPDTVNTVPPQTLDAFQDHGSLRATLAAGIEAADQLISDLEKVGIPLGPVCAKLLDEGVESFAASMASLMSVLTSKRASLLAAASQSQTFALGKSSDAVASALTHLEGKGAAAALWNKERSLFTADARHDDSVKTRLGWLRSPQLMRENIARLEAFAKKVSAAGFRKALLLGMGGSSLCPEVLVNTFGVAEGFLELRVLDSTDPDAVRTATEWATLGDTLFIVASKSGSTIEVNSFNAHFWELAQKRFGDEAGSSFIAITDPATALGKLATERGYLAIFENPADIGGRYSALSFFGLVPAALLGIDLDALLASAENMAKRCAPSTATAENPGLQLGAFIGGLAKAARDKMTLVMSPEIESLGSWIEQLVAESTGKLGRGVLPVDLEPLGAPGSYGADRNFVYIRLGGEEQTALDLQVEELSQAGFPVVTIRLSDPSDLGAEFYRWEVATAFAGAALDINPFDEPDVSSAKKATAGFIAEYEQNKALRLDNWVSPEAAEILATLKQANKQQDYLVFSAFMERTPERDRVFTKLRALTREKLGVATALGYGPRFLHSTGQLHKGGPNTGIFVLLRADVSQDLPIPGQQYSFGILRDAQALGDQKVLVERQRRLVRVNLGADTERGLEALLQALQRL